MDREYERYTVAWVPVPGTVLAEFGAAWTGCCTVIGEPVIVRPAWQRLSESAKVSLYPGGLGLRAPLTVPFTLRDGYSQWALESDLEEFAARHCSAHIASPVVRALDDQLFYMPPQPNAHLSRMIPELQDMVAPMVHYEAGPAPSRFAMPLTGVIGPSVLKRLKQELAMHVDGITGTNPLIASISLLGDPGDGQAWKMLHRYPLTGFSDHCADIPDAMAFAGPDLLSPIIGTGTRRIEEPQPA